MDKFKRLSVEEGVGENAALQVRRATYYSMFKNVKR